MKSRFPYGLADRFLEPRNKSGALVVSNNEWKN
jgi:hypothetical protein